MNEKYLYLQSKLGCMKGMIKFLGFAFLIVSTTQITISQNVKKLYSDYLVGTWKLDSLEFGNYNLAPQYQEMIKQKLPEIMEKTEVTFTKDKRYFKKGIEGEKHGAWSISTDGKYVLVKLDGETKVEKTLIISLTNDRLILAPDDPTATNSKAYMYKVKK